MKGLNLTPKQKERLLEMANKLFPEYSRNKKTDYGGIVFHHLDDHPGMLFGFKNDGSDSDTYKSASLFIHWFEFCISYLLKEISMKRTTFILNSSQFNSFYLNSLMDCLIYDNPKHPVDYLYEQFKKL